MHVTTWYVNVSISDYWKYKWIYRCNEEYRNVVMKIRFWYYMNNLIKETMLLPGYFVLLSFQWNSSNTSDPVKRTFAKKNPHLTDTCRNILPAIFQHESIVMYILAYSKIKKIKVFHLKYHRLILQICRLYEWI